MLINQNCKLIISVIRTSSDTTQIAPTQWLRFSQSSYPAEVWSEIFLRFSLPKVSWNLAGNSGEIFHATFSRVWVYETKISPKFHVENGAEKLKFHANFTLLGRSAEFSRAKIPTESSLHTRRIAIDKWYPKIAVWTDEKGPCRTTCLKIIFRQNSHLQNMRSWWKLEKLHLHKEINSQKHFILTAEIFGWYPCTNCLLKCLPKWTLFPKSYAAPIGLKTFLYQRVPHSSIRKLFLEKTQKILTAKIFGRMVLKLNHCQLVVHWNRVSLIAKPR